MILTENNKAVGLASKYESGSGYYYNKYGHYFYYSYIINISHRIDWHYPKALLPESFQ